MNEPSFKLDVFLQRTAALAHRTGEVHANAPEITAALRKIPYAHLAVAAAQHGLRVECQGRGVEFIFHPRESQGHHQPLAEAA